MTKYVVLARAEQGAWGELRPVEIANNAKEAAQKAYMRTQNREEIVAVVAVPERSWNPTPIRTETVSRVVLGAAPDPDPGDEAA